LKQRDRALLVGAEVSPRRDLAGNDVPGEDALDERRPDERGDDKHQQRDDSPQHAT
jgi:hypothetical protein